MNYQDYSLDDFAADAYFQKWVQHPDPDAIIFWEQWLEQNPDKHERIWEAKKLVATMRFQENEYEDAFIKKIWQNIEGNISDGKEIRPLYTSKTKAATGFFSQSGKIAATLLLLILAAAVFYKLLTPSVTMHTTAFGETKTIMLPDSSTVILNANSRLSYNKSWNTHKVREVWLEGEGFFQVRKKPAQAHSLPSVKFIVHVNLMDVEVLGTAFNVNTRRGKAQVVLNSGKVKLASNGDVNESEQKSIMMLPGELVERSGKNAGFTKKVVDPALYSSWRNGQFIFKTTPVAEIAAILEDTYGWKVEILDQNLARMTFTSTVPVKKPEVLLRLLAESFHVSIRKKGSQVVIGNYR
jgi:transmembrane sensor